MEMVKKLFLYFDLGKASLLQTAQNEGQVMDIFGEISFTGNAPSNSPAIRTKHKMFTAHTENM